MTTTTLQFDLAQAQLLNLNGRLHWAARGKKAAVLRQLALVQARQLTARHQRVHAIAEFTFRDGRRRDVHNWMPSVKALVDGIVESGLLPDDDTAHLLGPDLRISDRRSPSGRVWVQLTLTEIDLQAATQVFESRGAKP